MSYKVEEEPITMNQNMLKTNKNLTDDCFDSETTFLALAKLVEVQTNEFKVLNRSKFSTSKQTNWKTSIKTFEDKTFPIT